MLTLPDGLPRCGLGTRNIRKLFVITVRLWAPWRNQVWQRCSGSRSRLNGAIPVRIVGEAFRITISRIFCYSARLWRGIRQHCPCLLANVAMLSLSVAYGWFCRRTTLRDCTYAEVRGRDLHSQRRGETGSGCVVAGEKRKYIYRHDGAGKGGRQYYWRPRAWKGTAKQASGLGFYRHSYLQGTCT